MSKLLLMSKWLKNQMSNCTVQILLDLSHIINLNVDL